MMNLLLGRNPISRITTIAGVVAVAAQTFEQYSDREISVYGLVSALAAIIFARLTDEEWVKNTANRINGGNRE
jgi:hypothetical protein